MLYKNKKYHLAMFICYLAFVGVLLGIILILNLHVLSGFGVIFTSCLLGVTSSN